MVYLEEGGRQVFVFGFVLKRRIRSLEGGRARGGLVVAGASAGSHTLVRSLEVGFLEASSMLALELHLHRDKAVIAILLVEELVFRQEAEVMEVAVVLIAQ